MGCGEGLAPKNPKNACHHCRYMGNGAGGGWTLAGVICAEAAGTEASCDGSATWTTGASWTAGRVRGVVLATVVVLAAFVWGAAAGGVAAGAGAAAGG